MWTANVKKKGDTWTFRVLYIILNKIRTIPPKKKAVVPPLQYDKQLIHNNMSVRCGRPMLKNRGDTWTFSALYIIIKKVRTTKKKRP